MSPSAVGMQTDRDGRKQVFVCGVNDRTALHKLVWNLSCSVVFLFDGLRKGPRRVPHFK